MRALSHLAIRSLSATLHLVPSRLIPHLGKLLGYFIYAFIPWRLHVLRHNLRHAGYYSLNHIRTSYAHLGRSLLLSLAPAPRPDAVSSDTAQLADFSADCNAGGVLVCSAHLGIWELVPSVLAAHVPERSRRLGKVVYRPLHDTSLDRWLRRRRANTAGGEIALVPDAGSLGALRSALLTGGLVGLLPDQRPGNDSATVTAKRMLGIESCELSAGMAKLRQDTGCAVWFAALLAVEEEEEVAMMTAATTRPRLRLVLTRLASRQNEAVVGAAEAEGVVNAYAEALDAAIATAPSQYFWFHDRQRVQQQQRKQQQEQQEQEPQQQAAPSALRLRGGIGLAAKAMTAAAAAVCALSFVGLRWRSKRPRAIEQQKKNGSSGGGGAMAVPVVGANADAIANAVRTEGVCLVERVMDAEAVAALHQRVASIKPRKLQNRRKHRWEHVLPPKADPFVELSNLPVIQTAVRALLGPKAYLEKAGLLVSHPGAEAQRWHMDTPHLFTVGSHLPPHSLSVFVPLVDLIPANGPTEFHLGTHQKANLVSKQRHVKACCSAGSLVMYDVRIMHRGGPNGSEAERPVVYMTFSRVWYRDTLNP